VNPSDLIRELEKLLDVANTVESYFHHQTLMNANLHLSEPRPSPLAAKHRIATDDLKQLIDDLKEQT